MKKEELLSNPFDVLVQSAIEVARNALFVVERMQSDEMVCPTFQGLKHEYDIINEQFDFLKSLSKEDLESLRGMAHVSKGDNMDRMNDVLYSYFNEFSTEYTECFPYVSVEFEEFKYGKNSEKCLHLNRLRTICDIDNRATKEFLEHCVDYLSDDKECWVNVYTIAYQSKIKEFIHDTSASSEDLEYMLSYISRRESE